MFAGLVLWFLFFIKSLLLIIPLLVGVAFLTLYERKILGAFQKREGPNFVGFLGLLQPLADGIKLIFKETVIPSVANLILFLIAPLLTFLLSLLGWFVIPFNEKIVFADINIGLLYLLAISSLSVYGIIISGWASNSKYAFFGSLRAAAQMISYEVSMGLIIINVLLCTGSLNLSKIVLMQENIWFCFPLLPAFLMFIISVLAETNRAPFDLPEAEGELVAGYNVEYSAVGFALFFLGEYSNIILMSSLIVILFLGGWLPLFGLFIFSGFFWFSLKICFCLFFIVWVRAVLPRYRYDQLMFLGWKVFLPVSLGFVIWTAGFLIAMGWLPF